MKHIKKRFFFDYKKDELNLNEKNADFYKFDGKHEKTLIGKKGAIAFLELDDDQFIGGIVSKVEEKISLYQYPIQHLFIFTMLK